MFGQKSLWHRQRVKIIIISQLLLTGNILRKYTNLIGI